MQVPLDNLKGTFNLACESKLFFPYLWNCKKNKHTKLEHLPPMECYILNSMKKDRHAKFLVWYEKNKIQPFNLFESLKEYGENDTEILLHSVLEMRRILLEITNGYDIMLKVRCTLYSYKM